MSLSLCIHLKTYLSTELIFAVDFWTTTFRVFFFWWKIRCLHHGGVWLTLHHVNAFVFGNNPNLVRACESSWKLGCIFSIRACCFFPPCVWDPAIRKSDLLGSDLLFFTSPTYQPPASVAVKRNGWYFRGELLFPFLASIFYFNVWASVSGIAEPERSNHKFRPSYTPCSCCVFKHHCVAWWSRSFLDYEKKLHCHPHFYWAVFRDQNLVSRLSHAM